MEPGPDPTCRSRATVAKRAGRRIAGWSWCSASRPGDGSVARPYRTVPAQDTRWTGVGSALGEDHCRYVRESPETTPGSTASALPRDHRGIESRTAYRSRTLPSTSVTNAAAVQAASAWLESPATHTSHAARARAHRLISTTIAAAA